MPREDPDLELIAAACETNTAYLALGNEQFKAHDAFFVRNLSMARRRDANCIGVVRTEGVEEVTALIQRADEAYASIGVVRFDTDPLTPPETAARLTLSSTWGTEGALVLVLEDELRAPPKPFGIREVLSERDWRNYGDLYKFDLDEYDRRLGRALGSEEPGLLDEFINYKRSKAPAARQWIAYVDEAPVAYLTSWPGTNGIGIVEDLFTHPDFRHRGIATALLVHCVADARLRGAGPVIINAAIDDTPKLMYATMGFRPLFVVRGFTRQVESPAPEARTEP